MNGESELLPELPAGIDPDLDIACQVDARYLLCPLPVIRLQAALGTVATGQAVHIVCTDPGSASDIPAWCRVNEHCLLKQWTEDDDFCFLVVRDINNARHTSADFDFAQSESLGINSARPGLSETEVNKA